MIDEEEAFKEVLTMAQPLLKRAVRSNEGVFSPHLIDGVLAKVELTSPDELAVIDVEELRGELLRRWSHTIGGSSVLRNDMDHEPWLTSERKRNWLYWARYAEYMERKLSPNAVEALDETTDEVLGQLEDPRREGAWDRRGLVVGHVQSGKTGNYTGLICKAADSGYKIIIVLAGLHNNLRSQTQIRLDEGFLGFETQPNLDVLPPVGVGELDNDPSIRPNFGTNRSELGDFNTNVARNFGVTPEQRPWLFVVKKQKTVLNNLISWIQNHVANEPDPVTKRRLVTNLPLLVIDDECDHGSVDTGQQEYDENGNPDEEHNPKTINALIRTLLHSFSRKAYVGYTATPFANVFIHGKGATKEHGPDLFPSAFITTLGAPSNYIGPARVFNSMSEQERLPLLRELDDEDYQDWLPTNHKNGHLPRFRGEDALPPSLEEAVRSFVIACTVRKLRGRGSDHASMLVHVTRFTSVQGEVCRQIAEYHRHLKDRLVRNIDSAEIEARMKSEYLSTFLPGMRRVRQALVKDEVLEDFSWEEVRNALREVLSDIVVREINGSAKDALDYENQKSTGLKVIAIGGDKLARGLTLEGLTTSYFVRTTKMYDTLMQMGRWFGYRDGYLDVCRLYTSADLIEWYGHIAAAADELREDFDAMAAAGGTPRDFGLRVRSHSVLTVTSRAKMRHANPMKITFSGDLLQTIVFDTRAITTNYNAGVEFVRKLGAPVPLQQQKFVRTGQHWNGWLWRNVSAENIVGFLRGYQTHEDSFRVRSDLIGSFVEKMATKDELTDWTVALVGKEERSGRSAKLGEYEVEMLVRNPRQSDQQNYYSIGTLISPRDQAIDLTREQWDAALGLTRKQAAEDRRYKNEPDTPSGPAVRLILGNGDPESGVPAERSRGTLLLYLLDPDGIGGAQPDGAPAILAWAISLPGSRSSRGLSDEDYMANTVEWEGFSNGLG